MSYDEVIKAIANGFQQFSFLDFVDIVIIAVLIYELIVFSQKTRAFEVLKGVGLLFLVSIISTLLSLHTLSWLLDSVLKSGSIIIVLFILFQPEIRRMLEKIGHGVKKSPSIVGTELVRDMHAAILSLSQRRVGALIVVEQKTGLGDIIGTGTRLDAILSGALLENIFEPNTPLHDGAVIVRGATIVAAGCILPLSDDRSVARELGTRHRAALGVSTVSDSATIVVSEETGTISMARDGTLMRYVDSKALQDILEGLFLDNGESTGFVWSRRRNGGAA